MRIIPRLASVTGLSVALILLLPARALAVHDLRLLELDGNATNGTAPGYDWGSLFPTGSSTGEIAKIFVADGVDSPADTSYFAGGGSKDIYDVTQWLHGTGDVAPDKNEIENAWAAAYVSTRDTGRNNAGDLIFYFGADRLANDGDAQVGFWFFRNAVGRAPGGAFSGKHTVGDVLVLSDFTRGGRVSSVRVFKWVGAGGSDGPLHFLGSGSDCLVAPADAAMCAGVNAATVASPWPYTPKSGAANTFPQGSFFEGGINVTRLLPGVRCFGSYMAETRTSQSVSAVLKDLALGPFNTCPRAPAAPSRSGGSSSTDLLAGPLLPATGTEHLPGLAVSGTGSIALGTWLRAAGSRSGRRRRREPDVEGTEGPPPLSMTGFLLYG